MASLLDWFGKRARGAFAEINPFDNGENYQSVVHGAPKAPQQPQQPTQQPQSQRQRFSTGVDAFNSPTQQPKPQIDINANAQLSQQKQPKNDLLKDVPNFVAGSNKKFLGEAPKSIVNAVNFVGSGFNADEAERRTNEFLRSTGQINEQGNAPLAQGYDQDSNAFKAGEVAGTVQGIATDVATTAIPGAAAEKALRGLNIVQKGLQSANKGARIAGTVAPIVGGGLVSSAASQIKDPAQNAGQNFGTGLAFDVASSALGPLGSSLSRWLRNTSSIPMPATRGLSPSEIPQAASTPRPSAELPVRKSPQIELPQQPPRQPAPTSLDISATNIPVRPQLDRRIQAVQETPSSMQNTSTGSIPQLPTVNTKQVGKLDKAFRSTRSIIERQGNAGRELASGLQAARDTQELYLGGLQKAMPTVAKIARRGRNALVNKDFENFVEAAQGLAAPKNARVAQAVQEWRVTHPGVRERAVRAGLDVGDLGPDYYPHFVDYDQVFKDKNTYNQAINHLVKTGQAPNQEEAIKLLSYAKETSRNREFGNLEASRLIDLPFYDKTPNSFTSYLNSSAKRIAQTETFGQKDERALKLISKIGQEGGDTEAAKNAFDIAVGAKKYNPTSEGVSRGIRKYITTTRLGLGALTNTSQSVNTGIVTGHLRTMGSMLKQLNPKTREFVADTGVISDALLNDLRTQKGVESFTSKVLGKLVNKVTAPGFGAVEKFNRSVAATAGRDYALRLAQKGNDAALRKLGVTGDIKDRTLSEAQQIQAARKIVEKTQFKVDPQDLPGWVDSPGGKLVAQFRTFSYNQGKFFSNEVLKPAAKGNFLPLGRVLAALPLGYALYETRRIIDGRPQEEDPVKVGLQSFSKIGGAGLVLDIYQNLNPVGSEYLPQDRRKSMVVGAFGGPAAGFAMQAAGAISEAIQQKNTPEDESRLDGKVAVKSADGEKYTDLTPLSRFGIQQLPIIGTPTANRVLPYKKEAEADAGTPTVDAIKAVNKASKEKLKEVEKSVGKDNYQISNLSLNEKEQLISDGILTQDAIDEAERLVKDKRVELGLDKKSADKTYADKYNDLQKKFESEGKNWSPVEKAKKQKELNQLAVQKDFDNDTVDLYGMSAGDVYNLVSTDQNGNKMVENILKYGDALVAAGLSKTNKFRDKYGNIKLASASTGLKKKGGGKKKSSGISQSAIRTEAFSSKVPTFKAPPKGTASIVASPTFKKTAIKGYTPRIPKAPKTRVKKA